MRTMNDASERSRRWWNDGPEVKQPFGTRQATYRGSGFQTDGDGESLRHRSAQTHRRRDHPAGWAQPEPGTSSRYAGVVVSAVGAPGVGATGSGEGGAGGGARVVERAEAGGALGVAEGRCRRSKATRYPSGWRGLSALDLQHGRRAGRSPSPGSRSGCATSPRTGCYPKS